MNPSTFDYYDLESLLSDLLKESFRQFGDLELEEPLSLEEVILID